MTIAYSGFRPASGFTLIELTIGLGVGLVIIGVAATAVSYARKAVTSIDQAANENEVIYNGYIRLVNEIDFWVGMDNPDISPMEPQLGQPLRAIATGVPVGSDFASSTMGLPFTPRYTSPIAASSPLKTAEYGWTQNSFADIPAAPAVAATTNPTDLTGTLGLPHNVPPVIDTGNAAGLGATNNAQWGHARDFSPTANDPVAWCRLSIDSYPLRQSYGQPIAMAEGYYASLDTPMRLDAPAVLDANSSLLTAFSTGANDWVAGNTAFPRQWRSVEILGLGASLGQYGMADYLPANTVMALSGEALPVGAALGSQFQRPDLVQFPFPFFQGGVGAALPTPARSTNGRSAAYEVAPWIRQTGGAATQVQAVMPIGTQVDWCLAPFGFASAPSAGWYDQRRLFDVSNSVPSQDVQLQRVILNQGDTWLLASSGIFPGSLLIPGPFAGNGTYNIDDVPAAGTFRFAPSHRWSYDLRRLGDRRQLMRGGLLRIPLPGSTREVNPDPNTLTVTAPVGPVGQVLVGRWYWNGRFINPAMLTVATVNQVGVNENSEVEVVSAIRLPVQLFGTTLRGARQQRFNHGALWLNNLGVPVPMSGWASQMPRATPASDWKKADPTTYSTLDD